MNGREKIVSGEEGLQLATMSISQKFEYKSTTMVMPETAKVFTGSIITQTGKKSIEKEIRCTSLDKPFSGPIVKKEVYYIPSFGHLRYDLLKNIVDNPEYKKLSIDILRQFDNSIADICYTKADDGTYLESIITKDGVNMITTQEDSTLEKIIDIARDFSRKPN